MSIAQAMAIAKASVTLFKSLSSSDNVYSSGDLDECHSGSGNASASMKAIMGAAANIVRDKLVYSTYFTLCRYRVMCSYHFSRYANSHVHV